MEENMFEQTIHEDEFEETKSYDIGHLFYVSFFGGILATIIISTKNAKWLKISKQSINLLMGIGIAFLFLKILLSSAVLNGLFISNTSENLRYMRWGFRILALLLYFAYFQLMKQSYQKHILLGGQNKPLLKDAIILIVIVSIIEFILLLVGKVIIDYVV